MGRNRNFFADEQELYEDSKNVDKFFNLSPANKRRGTATTQGRAREKEGCAKAGTSRSFKPYQLYSQSTQYLPQMTPTNNSEVGKSPPRPNQRRSPSSVNSLRMP